MTKRFKATLPDSDGELRDLDGRLVSADTTEPTMADVFAQMKTLERKLARIIREASKPEQIAVSARDAATMLGVKRDVIYQLHHAGTLNGFRPLMQSELKFLVTELREFAGKMSEDRKNA